MEKKNSVYLSCFWCSFQNIFRGKEVLETKRRSGREVEQWERSYKKKGQGKKILKVF